MTEADSGRIVCLARDGRIEIYLHGSLDRRWSSIDASGTVLRPVASGKGALAVGVTGGFFAAAGTGTGSLSSSRPACASPITGTPGSTSTCDPAETFILVVVVG